MMKEIQKNTGMIIKHTTTMLLKSIQAINTNIRITTIRIIMEIRTIMNIRIIMTIKLIKQIKVLITAPCAAKATRHIPNRAIVPNAVCTL